MSTAGRPREFETEDVLDAALELFWTQGFRSTTTRSLESAVGITQSSLYNAFGSKRGLLHAALDRYESRLTAELLEPLEASDEGLGSVDSFLEALGTWLRRGKRGCMLVNMMAEDGGLSPEITERTRGYRKRVRKALHAALERAIASGELEGSPEGRANMLLGVVLGLNIAARGGAQVAELRAIVEGTREVVRSWSAEI